MALGKDPDVTCGAEFIAAMRALPQVGDNVDIEDVKNNLNALGKAVHTIATARAEVQSDAAASAAFWQWIAAVQAWMGAMATWQTAVTTAVNGLAPGAVPPPTPPPAAAPTSLVGRLR